MTTNATPRIYVASLSDYNAGRLHGVWIDADQSAEEIGEEVRAMLATSPEPHAEEWAIHDYDNFSPLRLSEYESFERVAELAHAIAEHGADVVAGYFDACGSDAAVSEIDDYYQGRYDSMRAFAEDYVSECGWGGLESSQLNDIWAYIDWDHIAHELEMSFYDSEARPYGVHVWRRY